MPRSNKLIYTKNPTNPRNFAYPKIKLANLKILATKHQKKTQQIWLTKKKEKKPKPKFRSQNHEKKKNPNNTDCGSVTCEGWFTVDLQWARSLIAWLWLGLLARIFLDLVFWAWFWLWWLGWVTGCVVLDWLRECLRQGGDSLSLGRRWDWEWVRVGG